MSATLSQVRDALATALSEIPGLYVRSQVQQVHTPAAIIELDRVEYHDTMDMASAVWTFNIRVLVSMNDAVAAQVAVDAYIAPEGGASIREALEADGTLGGVVSDTFVRSASGYQTIEFTGETFLGATIAVEVSA